MRFWGGRGVAAAAVAVFVTCLAIAFAQPPLNSADETGHVDYAVQVWHGHLPTFAGGLEMHTAAPARRSKVQYEAHHPPLYYALAAPVAGPLADRGHWVAATLAVRVFNSLLATLLVLSLGWAASLVHFGSQGWPGTVAAVGGTLGPIIWVGGAAFGDMLAALLTVVALGAGLLAVRRGVTPKLLAASGLLGAAGMLSSITFAIPLLIMATGLGLGVLLHSRWPALQRTLRGGLVGLVPIASGLLASGWFYRRNKHLTGHYTGSQPEYAERFLRRVPASLTDLVHDEAFQATHLGMLRHPLDGRSRVPDFRYHADTRVMTAVFVVVFLVGLVVALLTVARAWRARDLPTLLCFGMLAAALAMTLVLEVRYSMNLGGSVSRYLLPAALPLCVLLAAGLRATPGRRRGLPLAAYLALCYGMLCWWLLSRPHPGGELATGAPWVLLLPVPVVLTGLLAWQVRAITVSPAQARPAQGAAEAYAA